jgi:ubiquinone/menaquinone biosynthesis C-methylase UbiE
MKRYLKKRSNPMSPGDLRPQALESDDMLMRQLQDLPCFRAMVRSVEAGFYCHLPLPAPVLDLGCGDGHFASSAYPRRLEVGVDRNFKELHHAGKRQAYGLAIQAEASQLPFRNECFAGAISNSVLEHIPDVDKVLMELRRVLKPQGLLAFSVPNDRFGASLPGVRLLRRCGQHALADWHVNLFNRISRHIHTDTSERWQQRLGLAGFTVIEQWNYFTPQALRIIEYGHATALPALLTHCLTGRWIIAPGKVARYIPWLIARRHCREAVCEQGVYTFYVARRDR